jgi:hypothetical protein
MKYAYLDLPLSSAVAGRLLSGTSRDLQEACLPSCVAVSAVRAYSRQREQEICEPRSADLIVRWSIKGTLNERGCYRLHQPVIVGLLLPRSHMDPIRYIPWGTRARRQARLLRAAALARVAP